MNFIIMLIVLGASIVGFSIVEGGALSGIWIYIGLVAATLLYSTAIHINTNDNIIFPVILTGIFNVFNILLTFAVPFIIGKAPAFNMQARILTVVFLALTSATFLIGLWLQKELSA